MGTFPGETLSGRFEPGVSRLNTTNRRILLLGTANEWLAGSPIRRYTVTVISAQKFHEIERSSVLKMWPRLRANRARVRCSRNFRHIFNAPAPSKRTIPSSR